MTKPLKLKKTKPIASRGKPTHLPRLEVAIPIPRSKNFKTIKNKTLKEKITEDSIVKIVRNFFGLKKEIEAIKDKIIMFE